MVALADISRAEQKTHLSLFSFAFFVIYLDRLRLGLSSFGATTCWIFSLDIKTRLLELDPSTLDLVYPSAFASNKLTWRRHNGKFFFFFFIIFRRRRLRISWTRVEYILDHSGWRSYHPSPSP
jgi:hypothetical protein